MADTLTTDQPHTRVVGVVSTRSTWETLGHAEQPCDWVELRLDALAPADRLLPLSAPCPLPLLLTPRHKSEGGNCDWTEEERIEITRRLLPAATALDWEIAQLGSAAELLAEARARGVAIVASAHYFNGMPTLAEMCELEATAKAAGADIVKIAFTPADEAQMAVGVEFLQRPRQGIRAAVMGMGPLAPASRALYTRHGSALLYGYLGHTPTAPGQLSAEACRTMRDAQEPTSEEP